MTIYARLWSHIPILAGELTHGLWVKGGVFDLDTPWRPWSLVSTVLSWPSEPLPPSHPMKGTPPGDGITAVREALPATYVLVEFVTDRSGFMVTADTPTAKLEESGAADARWYAVPKMLEFVTLALQDPEGLQLGFWPDQLRPRQDG